ncbi:MAG TPA: hypothetical protein VG900_09770 [Hyphomicrobiaceae bacterium]|nr:hypothetical protein [Hyphomicrobiaceae bacterium]
MKTAAASTAPHLWSWIEAAVTGGFTLVFFLFAFFVFKPEHVEHHPTRVYIGAVLQGLIVGGLVAFVILPLRFAFFVPHALVPDVPQPPPPPKGVASLAVPPALLLLLVIRRGVLARVPLIGPFIRAYRRAALKHQIDGARRTLARLEALDARPAVDI